MLPAPWNVLARVLGNLIALPLGLQRAPLGLVVRTTVQPAGTLPATGCHAHGLRTEDDPLRQTAVPASTRIGCCSTRQTSASTA